MDNTATVTADTLTQTSGSVSLFDEFALLACIVALVLLVLAIEGMWKRKHPSDTRRTSASRESQNQRVKQHAGRSATAPLPVSDQFLETVRRTVYGYARGACYTAPTVAQSLGRRVDIALVEAALSRLVADSTIKFLGYSNSGNRKFITFIIRR